MDIWQLLLEIVVLLACCLLIGGIFARFGQSPIVGYLLVGVLLGGPGSVHLVKSAHDIETIAELGVSLLLFSLGLEFSLGRLKSLGGRTLLAGVIQVVVTTIVVALIAMALRLGIKQSIAIGAMVSLSSTACVLRVFMERAEVDSGHGRAAIAVLLIQDMAVVPLGVLMTILGGGGTPVEIALNVGRIIFLAAVLIVALYVLLNKLAVIALGTLTLERNRELTILLAVVTGLGAACAAHGVGISPALGAFVAGMFLGSSPFATQIRADVSSLRTVLLTLFFGAAGMVASPVWILSHWYLVLGVSALVVVGKTAIAWLIIRLLGQPHQVAAAAGVALAQIGEFAFVLGTTARQSGVVEPETYQLIVSVAITTLFLSPYLVPNAPDIGMFLASRLGLGRGESADTGAVPVPHPDVIVIGFGPAGQLAVQPLVGRDYRVVVIELSQEGVQTAQELGFEGQIGDATQAEVLEHADVATAKVVIITIPHQLAALSILAQVRLASPLTHVVVRSRYARHTAEFERAGAQVVLGDEEQLGSSISHHLDGWLAMYASKQKAEAADDAGGKTLSSAGA